MTRVVIADGHLLFRDGLRKLLEGEGDIQVVGEAGDCHDAIQRACELLADVLLLDVSMAGTGGLDTLHELSRRLAATRVLVLTAAAEESDLVAALRFGARGVVLKQSSSAVLLLAIRAVMSGDYWIVQERATDLVQALRMCTAPAPTRLRPAFDITPRELEVIAGVVASYSNRDIAQRLGIAEKTVKGHLTNVFQKLGISNRLELAMFALRHKLDLPDILADPSNASCGPGFREARPREEAGLLKRIEISSPRR